MRPVFSELVQELSRSLGFYRSTHREADLKRLVGLGNAFALPGLQKYLQQNLQMSVDRPTGFKMANLSEARNSAELEEKLPSFLVAYGLALQGLDQARAMSIAGLVKSNLLPSEIVRQVVWRKKRPYFVASAACLALAAGSVWFRYNADMGTLLANAGTGAGQLNAARAEQILKGGISGNPPKREQAATWLAVANAFSGELKKFSREGVKEQETGEALIELQRRKAVWPRVLEAIHSALPQPPAPLRDVADGGEYASILASSDDPNLDRGKRREIFIESLYSEYSDDLLAIDLLDEVEGDPRDTVDDPDKAPKKGFLVTIQCRTPNADQLKFVSDTLKVNLRKEGREPGRGFYIDRVVLTRGEMFAAKTSSSSSSGRTPGSGRTPRGGRGGGRTPPPTTTSRASSGKIDPVTDETMNDDWKFELKFDVVLRDYPASKEAKEEVGS
jgi:hypothetical protein